MKKIEKLSVEQEARLPEFRKEWLTTGLNTDPCDRQATEKAIKGIYEWCGQKAPEKFIWMDSPLGCQIFLNLFKNCSKTKIEETDMWANLGDNLAANLGDKLWAHLWDNLAVNLAAHLEDNLAANLGDNLAANLGDKLWANLGANLRDNLAVNLRDNLAVNLRDNLAVNLAAHLEDNLAVNLGDNLAVNLQANLGANLGAKLWANLGAKLGDKLKNNIKKLDLEYFNIKSWFFGGSLFSYWVAWITFAKEIGLKYPDKQQKGLNLMATLCKSSFWWYPFKGFCVCSEKPKFIFRENGRFHNVTGAAIEFRDGYKLWSIDGMTVTEQIVMMPETLTIQQIEDETNVEIRRIMIQRFGEEKYLIETKAVCIDFSAGLGLQGSAPRALYVLPKGEKILFGTDGSTKRPYFMRVPTEAKTCSEAHRMISGLDDENRLLVEC